MWKKVSFCILLVFPMLLLSLTLPGTARADQQSSYYDITLTTNNGSGGGGGTTTDPDPVDPTDPDPDGNGNGDQVTNGDNGGTNQTTKAPGSSTTASSQPKSVLSGLLPQTNNIQEGLRLGILVLILALLCWVIYLLIVGKRRGNTNEKIS